MRTNDLNTWVYTRDSRVFPGNGQTAGDEDWGSWIDPTDARDTLRVGTTETLRSGLLVRQDPPEPASEQPRTANPH